MDVDSILAKLPSGYKFLPTDSEIIDCLKSTIESRNPPPWRVHIVCFRDYKPQELAEKYQAASDHKWYFVTSWPVNVSYHLNEIKPIWKVTHKHTPMELCVYNEADGQLVGYKQNFEFLDENSHKTEWLMCVYYVAYLVRGTKKLSPFVLCKMYKDNEEEGRGDSILAKLPSGYKFLPTDSEIIDYLKRRIESRRPPPWRVHLICFRNHKPQELAEKYQAASDNRWYFVTSWPVNVSYHLNETKSCWKETHKHTPMELRVYNEADGQLVGYREIFEFHDENSHKTEWLMSVYYVVVPNRGTNKVSRVVLCKMYKDNEEEEGRGDSIHAKLPSADEFLPIDSKIIDYLKRRIESRNPLIVVFRNLKPQEFAEKYPAGSDNKWYFITSGPLNVSYDSNETKPGWKVTHKHTPMESRVYNEVDGQLVGYKQNFEFLDENSHKTEWLMCVYGVEHPDRGTKKLSRLVLCKMYKDNEEEGRGGKRPRRG